MGKILKLNFSFGISIGIVKASSVESGHLDFDLFSSSLCNGKVSTSLFLICQSVVSLSGL